MKLAGKTTIVTGASAGVGAACARLFASEGARVVLAARSAKALEQIASEIGDHAHIIVTDVSRREDCERLIDQTIERFGGIDVLVNNAGYHERGDLIDANMDGLENTIDVNLKAPIRLTKLALPHLLNAPSGSIVNVASLAGRFPLEGEAVYSCSKFALRAFSLALAEELADTSVSVSLVSPGPIDTGFIMDHIEDVPDMVFSQPMSTAEDIALAILKSVQDGRRERAIPAASGVLATAGYLFPGLRKALKPLLNAKGARIKREYLKDRA